MNDLESAYESLMLARNEYDELNNKKNRYNNIFESLSKLTDCGLKDISLSEKLRTIVIDRNNVIRDILLCLVIYLIVFGIVDSISYFVFNSQTMIWSSIGAILGSMGVNFGKKIKGAYQGGKDEKTIKNIISQLESDSKYRDKTIRETLNMLLSDVEQMEDSLKNKEESLIEYSAMLDRCNNEIATKAFTNLGIDASVTIISNPKKLEKRM